MADDPYRLFRKDALIWRIQRGDYISPAELADTLLENRGQALPDQILDYLVATLRGKVKRPVGRKKSDIRADIRESYARFLYERYLNWLQKRRKKNGLNGWSCIQDATWWQGAPNERAAAMTARWFKRAKWNVSARRIQNLVSSRK